MIAWVEGSLSKLSREGAPPQLLPDLALACLAARKLWVGGTSSPSAEFLLFIFESPRLTSSLGGARLGGMEPLGPVRTLSSRPPAQCVGWGR